MKIANSHPVRLIDLPAASVRTLACAGIVACALLAACDSTSGSQSKKTSIRGTATFPKAEFQRGERLE